MSGLQAMVGVVMSWRHELAVVKGRLGDSRPPVGLLLDYRLYVLEVY